MLPVLRAAYEHQPQMFYAKGGDGHFNDAGHKVTGEEIARFFKTHVR